MGLDEKALIQLILIQKQLNLAEIERKLAVPHEQIVKTVHSLNNRLTLTSIAFTDNQLSISDKCADELYGLLIGTPAYQAPDDVGFRQSFIELELTTHRRRTSLQSLADQFYVSKNTMFSDIKRIKDHLRVQQLSLNYSRKTGYWVSGSEYLLRNYLVQLTRGLLRSLYGKSCLRKWGFVNVEELKEISKRLLRIEQGTQIQLTDEQIEELPYILDIIMNRVRCHPQPWSCNIDRYDIRNTVQFPIIKRYFQDFAFLKDSDILYLSLHILSSNRIESAMDFLNSEEIVKATDQFVQSIKNKLVIHFMKETEFKEKLLLHVQPAIFRNLFGFHIHNPLTAHFKNEHREIFRTVADAAKSFANIVGHPLPDEEIAYLSMIVLGWLYQSAENQTSNLKAVVLCPNGTSISILLLENLKWMFPEIEFIGAFSFRQYREKPKDVDFIFTTKPIKSKARVIVVPPFLEPESRRQLHDTVAKLLQTDASIKAKEAVKVIKDLLPQSKRYTAEMMLKLFFAENQTVPPEETNQTNKLKIGRHNIMIVGDPVKWKDCLDVVFAPMLLRKTADQNYLDRCKDVFFKNYRQMLIGPMIYLPHTTASDNLNEPDIEIVLFRKSIVDPDGNHVQLMVGLVPAKNNEHVPLLLLLNHLFIQQQTKQAIVQAADKQKILQIISEKGNKMDKMNFLAPC